MCGMRRMNGAYIHSIYAHTHTHLHSNIARIPHTHTCSLYYTRESSVIIPDRFSFQHALDPRTITDCTKKAEVIGRFEVLLRRVKIVSDACI